MPAPPLPAPRLAAHASADAAFPSDGLNEGASLSTAPALAPPPPAPRLATHAPADAAAPWDGCKERATPEPGPASPEPALSGRAPDCA